NIPAASYVVAGTPDSNSNNNDIVSIASSSNSFSILTSLLKSAGLANILQQPGPYTIFAPTNEAFAALPPDVVEQLRQPKNKEVLMSILKYHVVPGELAANQISGGKLQTFEGEPIQVQVDSNSNQIVVNNTSVIQTDIKASNGVIHAVNQVLIPPDLGGPDQPKTDVEIGNAENNGDNNTDSDDVKPGRATRGGSSYIGVAANIGLEGDTELGETNFAVISKIGLTKSLSVRPAAVIGDDTVFLLPLTLDFSPRKTPSVAGKSVGISPYLGAGVAVEAGDDTDVGLLVTGGVDVPLGSRFTINGSANAAFLDDDTDVGLMFGIGYNF
ncbi:MAG: fasciclin domain-containing protein, partial [Cyanobacteria bacterium J06639_18]